MSIEPNLENLKFTAFGVGQGEKSDLALFSVRTEPSVQSALKEMVDNTYHEMRKYEYPQKYQPSEKHAPKEYLYFPLNDRYSETIRSIHTANNLEIEGDVLRDPNRFSFYFVQFKNESEERITALRRATQFKGVLKKPIIRLMTDTLKIDDGYFFKLDRDFDFLVDDENIYILHPIGFERIGQMTPAILGAVPENIEIMKNDMPFVFFDNICKYAEKHPRAAGYIASICQQKEIENFNRTEFESVCKQMEIEPSESNEMLMISDAHIMKFLELLDRRLYKDPLVKNSPETYKAESRRKVSG